MATTSVWPIKKRLDHVLDYATNPEKTTQNHPCYDDIGNVLSYATRNETVEYVTGLNCLPAHAHQQMALTKQAWNKTGGRLAYHGYQSFKPGEVTAAQAHEIAVELAQRMWGDMFQVVVATHIDRDHIHSHFVVNSVSFVDGKKYVHTKKDYYGGVRALSDEICREHGLSVIGQPQGKGKHYKESADEKAGKPTRRGLVKADVLGAIEKSLSFEGFVKLLESKGYIVKYGFKVKHIAITSKDSNKSIRLATLFADDSFEESGIRQRIEEARATPEESAPTLMPSDGAAGNDMLATTKVRRPRRLRMPKEHLRLNGWTASYYRYLYLLGKVGKRKAPTRVSFALRAELVKLDRYQRQFRFLQENRITSGTKLSWYTDALKNEIGILEDQRKPLYKKRREAWGHERPAITAEIDGINETLRPLRKKLRLCEQIAQDAEHIGQKVEAVQVVLDVPPARANEKAREKPAR